MTDTKQITLGTTAVPVLHIDLRRIAFSVVNMDTSITVYISPDPLMTALTGYPIYPRDSLEFHKKFGDDTKIQRYMIAASGTPVVAIDTETTEKTDEEKAKDAKITK
jgi:hypothetical protein